MTNVKAIAGDLFDEGHSCTRSVLQATSGSSNQELLSATAGFSCGIGKSGCLCGAITGGVMALGLKWRADRCAELMSAFKEAFQTTCCRGLSKSYVWGSAEHQANCRKITVATAGLVEELSVDQK
jgi:C_GCAxxG_C_C family probable redox protein